MDGWMGFMINSIATSDLASTSISSGMMNRMIASAARRPVSSAASSTTPQSTESANHAHDSTATTRAKQTEQPTTASATDQKTDHSEIAGGSKIGRAPANPQGKFELTEAEQRQVAEMKRRDAEVRAHESAHLGAAGAHAQSGMKLKFNTGPDGQRYATSGSVSISLSEVPNDPAATERKMQQVQAAALAPADPSSQDQRVAARAAQKLSKAKVEKSRESRESVADDSKSQMAMDRQDGESVGRRSSRADDAVEPADRTSTPSGQHGRRGLRHDLGQALEFVARAQQHPSTQAGRFIDGVV